MASSSAEQMEVSTPSRAAVKELLDQLKDRKVTFGSKDGYFVSHNTLKKATQAMTAYADSLGDMDMGDFIAMQDELNKVREANANARKQIASRTAELAEANDDLSKARVRCDQALAQLKELDATQGQVKRLKVLLDDTEKELGKAKLESKAAGKSTDVERAERALANESRLKEEVKALQARRKAVDAELALAKADFESEKALRARVEASAAALQEEIGLMKSAAAVADKSTAAPIKFDLEIRPALVDALIGSRGRDFLASLDHQKRLNMRDYADKLVRAANSGVRTRKLGDLIALAIEWMKSVGYAVREALRPWLNAIERDFRLGIARSISFYRDELRIIIGDFKRNVGEQKAKYEGRPAVVTASVAFAHTANNARRRAGVAFFGNGSWADWWSGLKSKALATYGKVKEWFFGRPAVSKPSLMEEMIADSSEELPPLPPPEQKPPRFQKTGKIAKMGAQLFG